MAKKKNGRGYAGWDAPQDGYYLHGPPGSGKKYWVPGWVQEAKKRESRRERHRTRVKRSLNEVGVTNRYGRMVKQRNLERSGRSTY